MVLCGKASLAESGTLQLPQSPSRRRFPAPDALLKFHGFDSSFNQKLLRQADGILAEETSPDKPLEPAYEWYRSRWDLVNLPCAEVRLIKALAKEEGGGDEASLSAEEARAAIAEELAHAGGRCQIAKEDISVEEHRSAGELWCTVRLACDTTTVFAAIETLKAAVQDKKAFVRLHEAFIAAGCDAGKEAKLKPVWSLDRVKEELRLAFPQYAESIEQELLKQLPAMVLACWKAYREAWKLTLGEEPALVEPLLGRESLLRRGDAVLPRGVARGQGPLAAEDARSVQGGGDLRALLADAEEGQRLLKEGLAAGSKWSAAALNCVERVPLDSERRTWTSASSDLAPNARHHDPGTQDQHAAFEGAKALQRPHELQPPVRELVELSRLGIVFESPADLADGLAQLLDKFEVAWLENTVRYPSAFGHRSVTLGVRQQVPVVDDFALPGHQPASRRLHISTLELNLKPYVDAKATEEQSILAELRAGLDACGVLPQHVERVVATLLPAIACTHGQRRAKTEASLVRFVEHYVVQRGTWSAEGVRIAEKIADELADQALAAEVPREVVVNVLEGVPGLNAKRALRGRRLDLMAELTALLVPYCLVDFEEQLSLLLVDLRSFPTDTLGRICLPEGWPTLPRFQAVQQTWREVSLQGELDIQARHQDLCTRAETLAAEELVLLGDAATDLTLELMTFASKGSADLLGLALVRLLALRGQGVLPSALQELSEAATWAAAKKGASARALGGVSCLLRWVTFEDIIVGTLSSTPAPPLLRQLREALCNKESEHWACMNHWEGAGVEELCRRLQKEDSQALALAAVLLEHGQAATRTKVAEALVRAENVGKGWAPTVAKAGGLPLLASMLGCGRTDRCTYAAVLALRNLASCAEGRPEVSAAGIVPELVGLVMKGSSDISLIALSTLNHLAKDSDEDAELIRSQGPLKVDPVGRVSKKRGA